MIIIADFLSIFYCIVYFYAFLKTRNLKFKRIKRNNIISLNVNTKIYMRNNRHAKE